MIKYVDLVEDTICAPITAQGLAGVSVVRVSGEKAAELVRALCPFLPDQLESHRIYYGELVSAETEAAIDQVLLSYFAKGRSFTGDEVIEISSHGSPAITNRIVAELFEQGCRQAEPGEFSFRAFYNGKIDLVQAESIQSLISSQNSHSGRWSLQQLSGKLSSTLNSLETELLSLIAHLEAGIDFVEQDIDPASARELLPNLTLLQARVDHLVQSYDTNKNLNQGFNVLFVGETNAGKSSLFNRFFDKEKAIVTDIEGTTRDLITENCYLGSLPVRLTDTAGLRESSDPVEKIGIEKARKEMVDADALLWVIDASKDFPEQRAHEFSKEKTFYIFNKIDLLKEQKKAQNLPANRCFFVSAKEGLGIEEVQSALVDFLTPQNEVEHKDVVTQSRHFKHLCEMSKILKKSEDMILQGESPDILSQELQLALGEVHAILGKNFDDQILDTIFSDFCIGK